MNTFIQIQCRTMISSVRVFLQACELAAKKDDGRVSNEEAITLKSLHKAAAAFITTLEHYTTS